MFVYTGFKDLLLLCNANFDIIKSCKCTQTAYFNLRDLLFFFLHCMSQFWPPLPPFAFYLPTWMKMKSGWQLSSSLHSIIFKSFSPCSAFCFSLLKDTLLSATVRYWYWSRMTDWIRSGIFKPLLAYQSPFLAPGRAAVLCCYLIFPTDWKASGS